MHHYLLDKPRYTLKVSLQLPKMSYWPLLHIERLLLSWTKCLSWSAANHRLPVAISLVYQVDQLAQFHSHQPHKSHVSATHILLSLLITRLPKWQVIHSVVQAYNIKWSCFTDMFTLCACKYLTNTITQVHCVTRTCWQVLNLDMHLLRKKKK